MRQILHKTDGVAYKNLNAFFGHPFSCPRIECAKEPVFDKNTRVGKCVYKCAFAGVGISDDTGFEHPFSAVNLTYPALVDVIKFPLEIYDSFGNYTPVDFQLLLTRPSCPYGPDSTGGSCSTHARYAVQVRPHPGPS